MKDLRSLDTRHGTFVGQLYVEHTADPGVTVYRNSRGYACGIARDGERFVILGSRFRYLPHVLADYKELFMGM